MGNLVSSHPRPTPRSRRRRSSSASREEQRRRRAALATTTTTPAQTLLAAIADGAADAANDDAFASFSRALASLPPSSAALVCRQDPRLLHAAAASGDLRILRAVLDRGGNPSLPCPALGAAPLHAASTPQATRLLIASGGNAFLADARGRTPADLAGRGMVAPGGAAGGSAAAAAAAALVRAFEGGAPWAGRAAILCGGGGGGASSSAPSPYARRRSSSHSHNHNHQSQNNWVEAWVVVSPVYESRPFGASPPRAALTGELRAYAVPQFAASNADTLFLAAPSPFLRIPLDGCRVEREEAEDAAAAAGVGTGVRGVRLLVLPGDPRCLLPRRWRVEDEEEGTGLGGISGGGGGTNGSVNRADCFVLRLRPSVMGEQGLAPAQTFSRLVALCRDQGLRESAAAAAAAGGLAVAAGVAAAVDADDAAAPSPSSPTNAAAAPTIPLPPPEVMAAAEASELLLEEDEEEDGGGTSNAANSQNQQQQQQQGRCVVCWAAKASMGLVHGGTAHVCACARCARRLATSLCPACPVCRQPCREVVAVFRSEV